MKHLLPARFLFVVLTLAATICGCSGRPKNVARSVSGKVTVGGQALSGANIVFSPVEKGSPSVATTDANGEYSLVYSQQRNRKVMGAQIGEHVVQISTLREEDSSAEPPRSAVPEKVPFKYREGKGLTATVTSGSNTINFDLEDGPIEPPKPKTKGKAGKKVIACF